jgi:hypothetical protein
LYEREDEHARRHALEYAALAENAMKTAPQHSRNVSECVDSCSESIQRGLCLYATPLCARDSRDNDAAIRSLSASIDARHIAINCATTRTTMSACLMRVCASRCGCPSPPTAVAQSRGGGRIPQRWRRDGPITCGRSQRCGSLGCRHGLSHKRLKKRCRLMRMALSSCRALRERPGGLDEGLHTWFEGC